MAPSEVCELDFHQYRGVFYTVTYGRFEDLFWYSDFLPHTKLLDIEFDIFFHAWYCSIGKDELFSKHTWSSHLLFLPRGCRGRDRMIDGFPTTYAISAYYH